MSGAEKIAQERRRQIERLGFGPEHDSMHTSDELRSAALAVLTRDETLWPWNDGWKDARSTHDELVVAGALIAAALDVHEVETPDYCGCCGREIVQGTTEWCMDCLRDHIDTLATRPEEATYFAQHGTNCPFEAGEVETPCAACGHAAGSHRKNGACLERVRVYPPTGDGWEICPCNDYTPRGVETPEAARAKAIKAIEQALLPHIAPGDWAGDPGKEAAAVALDAILAQGWTPPGTEDAK